MLNITSIPYNDLLDYFILNDEPVPIDDVYVKALQLITSGRQLEAPPSVTDWIIANNLQTKTFEKYDASYILLAPDNDLKDLAHSLTLDEVDKERIIRILGYLGFLNNDMNVFNRLPADILKTTFSYLDCKDILLICKLSKGFSNFCQLELDNVLRQNLAKNIKLNTINYNRDELINLCKIKFSNSNIAAGQLHSLILKNDGNVYSFGENSKGQLGLGDIIKRYIPTLIPNLYNITEVSAGEDHSLALNANGEVYKFGAYEYGDYSIAESWNTNPILVKNLTNVIQVSAGAKHCLTLITTGQVYVWGYNNGGQLGLGNNTFILNPKLLTLNNIIQVSGGGNFSLFLNDIGQVYACGYGYYGQLGLGDSNGRLIPTLINNLANIKYISAGGFSSALVTNKGQVYVFGHNDYGELGLPTSVGLNFNPQKTRNRLDPVINPYLTNINIATMGLDYLLCLTNPDENNKTKLFVNGNNSSRQLGLGDGYPRYQPEELENFHNIIQISPSSGQNQSVRCHTLIMTNNGNVYGFGDNIFGQLGLGDENDDENESKPTFIMSIY